MTREVYFTKIYNQRSRTLRWLRGQGVPTADSEIMVDAAIISLMAAYDKTGKENWSLMRGVHPWHVRWKERRGIVVPVSVDVAEKINERHGRVLPHRPTDE